MTVLLYRVLGCERADTGRWTPWREQFTANTRAECAALLRDVRRYAQHINRRRRWRVITEPA